MVKFTFIYISEWAVSPFITTPQEVAARLNILYTGTGFTFWPDEVSLVRDLEHTDLTRITGHNQITDRYLALPAQKHRGEPATFDRSLVKALKGTSLEPSVFLVSMSG